MYKLHTVIHQILLLMQERLSNWRGWVGRESWFWDPPCIHVMYTYFYAVSNALSQQRFCPRSCFSMYTEWLLRDCAKDVMLTFCQWFIFYYLSYFFLYQRLEILETDNTFQTIWLRRTSILWLIMIRYFSINVSYRKTEHLIQKEFVCGVVSKNSWPPMKTKIAGDVC